MKTDVGFDMDDFISKLVSFMRGRTAAAAGRAGSQDSDYEDEDGMDELDENRQLDWDLIGRKVLAKSRRVPVMDFMLVSFFQSFFLFLFTLLRKLPSPLVQCTQ